MTSLSVSRPCSCLPSCSSQSLRRSQPPGPMLVFMATSDRTAQQRPNLSAWHVRTSSHRRYQLPAGVSAYKTNCIRNSLRVNMLYCNVHSWSGQLQNHGLWWHFHRVQHYKTLTIYYVLYNHVFYSFVSKRAWCGFSFLSQKTEASLVVCWPVNNAVLILYDGMSTCKQCCIYSIWECCKIVQYYKELWAASNSIAASVMVIHIVHGSSVNVSVWNIVHVELIR